MQLQHLVDGPRGPRHSGQDGRFGPAQSKLQRHEGDSDLQ